MKPRANAVPSGGIGHAVGVLSRFGCQFVSAMVAILGNGTAPEAPPVTV